MLRPVLDPGGRADSLDPVELSGLSMSIEVGECSTTTLLLWRRWRLEELAAAGRGGRAAAPGPGAFLGGAAAIGTTPLPPAIALDGPAPAWYPVGVFPADAEPPAGLSPSLALPARFCTVGGLLACAGVVGLLAAEDTAGVEPFLVPAPVEALALAFLLDRVLVPPTETPVPEPRFRFLMTSVFKLRGLTTPWSFRKSPQALQRGLPSGFRRQSGVVWVAQFVHVGGVLLSLLVLLSPWLLPPVP